jgi:hypothetical protein
MVGDAAAPPTFLADLAPLAEAPRLLPARFTEQQLVDFLKWPVCKQPTRQVFVDQLGGQCGRPFADQ